MSDGAAFVMVVSESFLKELDLDPIAKLISYSVSGVEPRIMGCLLYTSPSPRD